MISKLSGQEGEFSEIAARKGGSMSSGYSSTTWYHSNRYCAQAACAHCGGIVRHETWCITLDPVVYYAYRVVLDPSQLTLSDSLILHALGVAWENTACHGNCKAPASR